MSLGFAEQGPTTEPPVNGLVIALTSSTRSLGSYLLYTLSIDPVISEIYCLNRSTAARQRWETFSEGRNTDKARKQAKVTYCATNFVMPRLGLADDDFASYNTLQPHHSQCLEGRFPSPCHL